MRFVVPLGLLLAACQDTTRPVEGNPEEVITTVVLAFTPRSGGEALTFRWADPENDGNPVVDEIVLSDGEDYDLAVSFLNELEAPPEDITVEVAEESDQHQVFVFGSGVEGPATGEHPDAVVTHAYADTDDNGLPVGLENTVVTDAAGTGTLEVVLRHLPSESGTVAKVDGLAEQVAADGFAAVPGDTDVQVSFDLVVQ